MIFRQAMPTIVVLAAFIAALGAADTSGNVLVKTGQFFFPRLQFELLENVQDKWDVWPVGDQRLRDSIKKMTNINILTDPVVVNLDHPDQLFQYPFVFMTSEGHFKISESSAKNLREFLMRGGFLFADDCVFAQRESRFYKSWCEEMRRLFPDQVVREIPNDHEIFTCFYKLTEMPWVQGDNLPGMGVFEKESGRLMALCVAGDLHCGWVGFGNLDQNACARAIQMGVNIVVYSLTH